ncbi:hypothetical protein M3Y97_00480500 [Aphelenchoides bicaudatus]|nr:hypothetical protein M3Y97_00480500 [Aphelenchoides bicaudatus]
MNEYLAMSDPNNSATPLTNVEPTTESKNLFGKEAVPQKPLFGGTASETFSSFSSFANGSGNGSFLNNTGGSGGVSTADPKQFKLFGSAQNTTTDNGEAAGDDMAPEGFAPDDAQFKRPDIALPDLIEAKTGEDDGEVIFSARCRLYRFLPGNEVKEHGTGDIKLLKARATGKIRCVMRREQVLKVCANFAVQPGFVINTTKRGDNVLTWACKDYSEDSNGEDMTLVCRFKDVATANQFKEITQSSLRQRIIFCP